MFQAPSASSSPSRYASDLVAEDSIENDPMLLHLQQLHDRIPQPTLLAADGHSGCYFLRNTCQTLIVSTMRTFFALFNYITLGYREEVQKAVDGVVHGI